MNLLARLFDGWRHGFHEATSPLRIHDTLDDTWISLTPGQHVCLIGVSGSGKSTLVTGMLAGLRPEVDTGLARIYGIDLKGGVELGRFGGYLACMASTLDQTTTMLEQLDRELDRRLKILRAEQRTHIRMSTTTPLILVVVDEAAELTGGIDKTTRQQQERARILLDRLLRLGRACLFTVLLASQDPRKESVPLRDRCPVRIALRLNSVEETKMLLGDSAVQAGAAPWLIGIREPGTGYLYDADQHRVVRFRVPNTPDRLIRRLRESHTRIDPAHDQPDETETDDHAGA